MISTKLKLVIFSVLILTCLAAPRTARPDEASASGWMRILGLKAETLTSLDHKTFMAGNFLATSVAPAADGNFLVAGYVEPYNGHNGNVFLLSLRPDGGLDWYREYVPPLSKLPGPLQVPSDCFAEVEVVPTPEGNAVLFFDNIFLKVNGLGEPQYARRYDSREADGSGPGDSFAFKSAIVLADGTFFVAGNHYPDPNLTSPPPASVLVARLDSTGAKVWAKEYRGFKPCQRPSIALSPQGFLVLGAEPRALAGLDPRSGNFVWARQLYHLPFERGPKQRPDRGDLQNYRSLALTQTGDIIFGGVYELAYVATYRAPSAFVCRLSPDARSVQWARHLHDPAHGGSGCINAIAMAGDDLYLVGTSTAFGASHIYQNNNLLAVRISGGGDVAWIRSLGKKKISVAHSEYGNEMGNDVALGPDGSLVAVGGSDAFALPDPGFHRVIGWAKERYDLLLARITAGGGIANLPEGKYPRLLSAPDPGDPKKVDIVSVPIAVQNFSASAVDLTFNVQPLTYSTLSGDLQVQFSTVSATGGISISGSGNRPPVADFTLLDPSPEWDLRVRFDGTISADPDGDAIARYNWDFGDGQTGTGPKPIHTYGAGTFDVTLTIQDSKYNEATVTKKIVVGYELRGKGIPAAFCSGQEVHYTVTVETGDIENAGTDAAVYIAFFGPKDKNGARMGSGETDIQSPDYQGDFERGKTDTFTYWFQNLDQVEMMTLRHSNTGKKPGWFVKSVTVKNLDNNKEWHFVPNQWLDDREAPSHRTWEKFFVAETYSCGIFFKGNRYSSGMSEAGGGIFILPSGVDKFYFTPLDRSWEIQVWSKAGVLVGQKEARGQGTLTPPYINKDDFGVAVDASLISTPRPFKVKLRQGSGTWEESWVWVFPASWRTYEKEARRVVFLYPLKDQTGIFDYGVRAKEYLLATATSADMQAAWQPILDYGAASLGILINNPDPRLEWYFSNNTENYSKYKVLKVMAKLLVKADKEMEPVISQFFSLMDTLIKAQSWGSRLGEVINFSAAAVYKKDLLREVASNDTTFLQILDLFGALQSRLTRLVSAVDRNAPAECRTILEEMRTITVGSNPKSEETAAHAISYRSLGLVPRGGGDQYPLSIMLNLMFNKIREWRARWHLYLDGYILPVGLDKSLVTNQCLDIFEPVIENLAQIASIFIDTALLVDPSDPQWMSQ
jgi:PKD repeat protein